MKREADREKKREKERRRKKGRDKETLILMRKRERWGKRERESVRKILKLITRVGEREKKGDFKTNSSRRERER